MRKSAIEKMRDVRNPLKAHKGADMNISKTAFKNMKPCKDGLKWFKEQKDYDLCSLVKSAISGGIETMKYANWGIVRIMTLTQKRQYAIYAAKQVLHIFEAEYPNDKRPRLAIEAAEKYLAEPTDDNRIAANAAANAANAAAYAAYAQLMAKILRYGGKLLNTKGAK